ncbi:hypothetical protein C8R42DRAFT_644052 [Lentinula raphanica]|nr:hypothetical protein C8R42DRAFT_644052 [Lentinula raphanica]
MSCIQQPHSVDITPLGIPTFDHGRQRRVYRYWPLDYRQRPIPIDQLWTLRKKQPAKWDIFCDSNPSAFPPAGLDDIYRRVLELGPFPNPDYPPPPPAPFSPPAPTPSNQAPPAPASFPVDPDTLPSFPPESASQATDDGSPEASSATPAPPETLDINTIFEEIWAAFQEYDENPVQQELIQAFAGQSDVIVTPDGFIHYEPDLFSGNNTSSLGETVDNETVVTQPDDMNTAIPFDEDGDITLVDIHTEDIKDALGSKVENEPVTPRYGTKEQPYDLTAENEKSMFVELCDTCGNDVENHDTAIQNFLIPRNDLVHR